MSGSALIICIGNDLVADDGVGHVIYHSLLLRELPDCVRIRFSGLGGMAMLEEFRGEDLLVVVDAVQFGSAAGTIHVLSWKDLPQSSSHVSCHGIGIREAIEVSRKLYPETTPGKVWLVGIEGQCFDRLGEDLSAAVAASVEPAIDKILEILRTDLIVSPLSGES
ncbi:MAG: hydrogenase maturation protease [Desulfopila sp.]|jgi:hydrogenase maturation protease|nr:hydrogenase maturation protease [Desulfopila sp.]